MSAIASPVPARRIRRRSARRVSALAVAGAVALSSFVSASAATVAAAAEEPPAPILQYDLTQASSAEAVKDRSGHGRDGVFAGTFTREDDAMSFSGDDHIGIPQGVIDGLEELTVTARVKTRSTGNHFIWSLGSTAGTAGQRYLFANSNYRTAITPSDWRAEQGAQSAALPSNAWVDIAATIARQGDGTYRLTQWLNAEPVASVATTTLPRDLAVPPAGAAWAASIGKSLYSADRLFVGAMSDFRIYDRALTAAELQPPADPSDTTLRVVDTEQVLTQRISEEGDTKVLTVVLDHWSPTGAVDGSKTDKSDLDLAFTVPEGATVTERDGSPLADVRDYREPRSVSVTAADGTPTDYEVRVEVFVAPVRIPGLVDATGTVGKKFFADPEVFVDNGKYYIFPTTDGYSGWNGTRIHAFESEDLVTWEDKGVVVDLRDQNLDGTPDTSILPTRTQKAWAPAMAKRDGKYYLYFSGDGQINVAVSDHVDRGYQMQSVRVESSIDPAIFEDPETGKWYMTWGQTSNTGTVAELNDDMMSIKPGTRFTFSAPGFREGAFIHSRVYEGVRTYYFTYSVDDTNTETYRIRYATAPSITGPWTYQTEILNRDVELGILGTGHESIVQVPGTDDWYMVYHAFLTDEMRPRLVDQNSGQQIRTGNKREIRIARMTYTEPTGAEVAQGAVPLIQRVPVTYDGVPAETIPTVEVAAGSAPGTPVDVGAELRAEFAAGWSGVEWSWLRDGEPIEGAASPTYVVDAADAGHEISVAAIGESTTGVLNNAGTAPSRTFELRSSAVEVVDRTLDVSATTAARCVAGKVVQTVTVTSGENVPMQVSVTTAHGTKMFPALAPGKSSSAAFTTRAVTVPAGSLLLEAGRSGESGEPVVRELPVPGATCAP